MGDLNETGRDKQKGVAAEKTTSRSCFLFLRVQKSLSSLFIGFQSDGLRISDEISKVYSRDCDFAVVDMSNSSKSYLSKIPIILFHAAALYL